MNKGNICILVLLTSLFLLFSVIGAPTGASDTEGTPETKSEGTAGDATAEGGNITEINLSGSTQSIHWQGFWGHVSGAITLDDASDNTLYNWSMGTMSGNVYISNVSSNIGWGSCASVSAGWCDNIIGSGDDSCTNTFNDGTKSFNIAGNSVSNVNIVQTYDSTGAGAWDEGIVNCSNDMVFASTIYDNANSFKNGQADFQSIVPVNGSSVRTYYFYLELGV